MGVGAPWSRGSAGTGHAKDGCTHLAPPLDTDRPTCCRLRPRLGHPLHSRNPFITPPHAPYSDIGVGKTRWGVWPTTVRSTPAASRTPRGSGPNRPGSWTGSSNHVEFS